MVSQVFTERRHSGGFMVSEEEGTRSRDQVTLLQQSSNFQGSTSPVLPAGVVLGATNVGTSGTYAANSGNTGNFTAGAVAVGAGVVQGTYSIEFISATAYNVFLPNGDLLGEGKTGVAFSAGGLGFTLTAGGTPAVAGDGATIAIAVNSNAGLYAPLSLTAADGTQNALAILFNETDASQGNTKVTVISRACEVNGSELIYPSGATTTQIAAINAQLQTLGIIVR
jgi:Bacteriophage lambda head decoration protein D